MLETPVVSPNELFSSGQIRLAELSVFNWGSFHGLHTAKIDPDGTLITGDNGAGKSTLIDGLMALLLPSSKASFNIAAAQGDRADRTLMSYIRGNYGKAHDGTETAILLKRSGATATALRALYRADDGSEITLAGLFWITQASNSLNDLKRLFVIGKRDFRLEELLHLFGEGNARLLKQHLKEDPLVEAFDSFSDYQETYVRLLRMENRNAPALLSRALGLKKIDDLTSLIRDLVLEPSQVKEYARQAVSEFDDLVSIHNELDDARRQRDALIELPETSQALSQAKEELNRLIAESAGLSVYFGEQCHRLWGLRFAQLDDELKRLTDEEDRLKDLEGQANGRVQTLYHAYQSQGGERLEGLRREFRDATSAHGETVGAARAYQMDVRALSLPEMLSADVFKQNQAKAQSILLDMPAQRQQAQDRFAEAARELSDHQLRFTQLASQIQEIEARPDSNIAPDYQRLRDQIVESLSLDRSEIVFIGELLDVREEHKLWRGAIERALGGLRNTLLVPDGQYRLVTKWLNARHTGLHVRVQVVRAHEQSTEFIPDGFLRKIEWRVHGYRDWLKKHLSRFDLGCVDSTETLDQTPFSMTIQGLMHLDKGRFEKKDQQRVDDPRHWCLGFSNKNRLAALKADQAALDTAVCDLGKATQVARSVMDNLEGSAQTWGRIAKTSWAFIDVQSAQARMDVLRSDLDALERPDSDLGMAKARWEAASAEHSEIRSQQGEVSRQIGGKESDIRQAKTQIELASEAAQAGLVDVVRESLTTRVGQMHIDDLEMASEIETRHRSELDETRQKAHVRESKTSNRASAIVTRFKTEWPLIANDWLGGIDGLDDYLDHLVHLETEGLPDLVDRFRERLNRNATQSLARISQAIDAEREDIRDRIETINEVLERTEFKHGTFLRLGSRSEIFEHVKAFNSQMIRVLARAGSDDHDWRFRELKELVEKLEKATNPATSGTLESLRLLDSRYQLSFFAEEVEKDSKKVRDVLESSSGKSGGEKESFAGTIVAASLAYVLTPDGYDRPLYCTVFLDEAFSNTAEAVSRRVLKVFRELKIHVNLITPYKNLNLARESARSLLIAERDQDKHESRLCEVTWEEIDKQLNQHEHHVLQGAAKSLGIEMESV
ncbi:ATP-binding protein [Pseudomonas agarici]|uniref:ATP-binding protein n=1 Tax=Pseudomonas agarici TaxID=46677 RepID=UPI0015A23DAC|nr:ATP-binding protein [Pseudomonas agarici]NWB90259.1 AAA family ATPase [Pseudomonas agarici]